MGVSPDRTRVARVTDQRSIHSSNLIWMTISRKKVFTTIVQNAHEIDLDSTCTSIEVQN